MLPVLGGDAEKALGHYERSLEVRERLLRANPESGQAARDVSVSLNKLADFLASRGQPGDATGLRQQAEMLASLSLKHLSSATRNKLADDDLSVNAYPTDCGGFVYVGAPKYRVPSEPDLAMLFEVAESAGVAWLMFDREAAVIDGLPVFDSAEPGP